MHTTATAMEAQSDGGDGGDEGDRTMKDAPPNADPDRSITTALHKGVPLGQPSQVPG